MGHQAAVLALRRRHGDQQRRFTTTFHGDQYALNTATGAILRKIPLSAGTNAPVTVDGDYVIAGAGVPLSKTQQPLIIAYKLGATGELPETVSP
jgi:hypothetical protein